MRIYAAWAFAFVFFICAGLGQMAYTHSAALSVLSAATIWGLLRYPVPNPNSFLQKWILYGWPILLLASLTWAPHITVAALDRLSSLIVLTVGLCFLQVYVKTREDWVRLARLYCYLGAVWAVWLCVQAIFLRHAYQDTAFNPALGGHISGVLMLAAFILQIGLSQTRKDVFILFILFAGLIATNVQAPFFGAVLIGAIILATHKKPLKIKIQIIVALSLAFLGMQYRIDGLSENKIGHQVAVVVPISIPLRVIMWQGTWQAILEHPFTGHGLGRFAQAYAAHRSLLDKESGLSAHNDILQYWSEIGVSFIVYLGVFIAAFGVFLAKHKNQFLIVLTPVLGAGAIFTIAQVNPVLLDPAVLMVLGLCLHGVWLEVNLKKENLIPNWIRQVLAVLIVVGGFGFSVLQVQTARSSTAFQMAIEQGDVNKTLAELDRSNFWNLGLNPAPYVLRAALGVVLLQNPGLEYKLHESVEIMITENALKALEIEPGRADAASHLAKLAEIKKDKTAQYQWLNYALHADPAIAPVRMDLYRFYMNENQPNRAYETLKGGQFVKSWYYDRTPLQKLLVEQAWLKNDFATLYTALPEYWATIQVIYRDRMRAKYLIN